MSINLAVNYLYWGGALKDRLDYLDGLRGVAILLVLGFHAYARWPEIVPYGDTYQDFPIFKFGWLGVQLFFLISGFVIFMTLEKTLTLREFIYKRWLRLFPAMLLASFFIYVSSYFLHSRPAGDPSLYSLIPGLTFIEPSWWDRVFGFDVGILEGAFWSLYVEFKFYVIAGIIYFLVNKKLLAPLLLIFFVGYVLLLYISSVVDYKIIHVAYKISLALSFKHFGWFASGAFFYMSYKNDSPNYFCVALVSAVFSSFFVGSVDATIAALLISLIFAASLKVNFVQKILVNKVIMFFGFISYPLYLIHENAMISMIVQFSNIFYWINVSFIPAIPIVILSALAYLCAKKYESFIRVNIKDFLGARI